MEIKFVKFPSILICNFSEKSAKKKKKFTIIIMVINLRCLVVAVEIVDDFDSQM